MGKGDVLLLRLDFDSGYPWQHLIGLWLLWVFLEEETKCDGVVGRDLAHRLSLAVPHRSGQYLLQGLHRFTTGLSFLSYEGCFDCALRCSLVGSPF